MKKLLLFTLFVTTFCTTTQSVRAFDINSNLGKAGVATLSTIALTPTLLYLRYKNDHAALDAQQGFVEWLKEHKTEAAVIATVVAGSTLLIHTKIHNHFENAKIDAQNKAIGELNEQLGQKKSTCPLFDAPPGSYYVERDYAKGFALWQKTGENFSRLNEKFATLEGLQNSQAFKNAVTNVKYDR